SALSSPAPAVGTDTSRPPDSQATLSFVPDGGAASRTPGARRANGTGKTGSTGTDTSQARAAGEGELPAVPGYEVLDVLGKGGMGVVYRARHLELRRLVALKMILHGGRHAP